MFKEIGMSSTFVERHDMIIPQRVRYYSKDSEDLMNVTQVLNAPIFDDLVSIEAQWPSGDLVSTVPDLLKFGNFMINSYRGVNDVKSGINLIKREKQSFDRISSSQSS
jgi:CubicO group peptidase (beta-lactamase class C family)